LLRSEIPPDPALQGGRHRVCFFAIFIIMMYQITLDVPENKISLIEQLFRSISFVKEVKALEPQKEQTEPNKFNAMKIKTKNFKFDKEKANER